MPEKLLKRPARGEAPRVFRDAAGRAFAREEVGNPLQQILERLANLPPQAAPGRLPLAAPPAAPNWLPAEPVGWMPPQFNWDQRAADLLRQQNINSWRGGMANMLKRTSGPFLDPQNAIEGAPLVDAKGRRRGYAALRGDGNFAVAPWGTGKEDPAKAGLRDAAVALRDARNVFNRLVAGWRLSVQRGRMSPAEFQSHLANRRAEFVQRYGVDPLTGLNIPDAGAAPRLHGGLAAPHRAFRPAVPEAKQPKGDPERIDPLVERIEPEDRLAPRRDRVVPEKREVHFGPGGPEGGVAPMLPPAGAAPGGAAPAGAAPGGAAPGGANPFAQEEAIKAIPQLAALAAQMSGPFGQLRNVDPGTLRAYTDHLQAERYARMSPLERGAADFPGMMQGAMDRMWLVNRANQEAMNERVKTLPYLWQAQAQLGGKALDNETARLGIAGKLALLNPLLGLLSGSGALSGGGHFNRFLPAGVNLNLPHRVPGFEHFGANTGHPLPTM